MPALDLHDSAQHGNQADASGQEHRTIYLDAGTLTVEDAGGEQSIFALNDFASRRNPKRGFLFVSKALGRYQPVTPAVARSVHWALTSKLPEISGPVVFLGIAEAGVALAHGIFEAFRASRTQNSILIHTSRHQTDDEVVLAFQETHSHAPSHRVYRPKCSDLRRVLDEVQTLVVVDDEITTGNTFRALAQQWCLRFPQVRSCHHLVVTSWMQAPLPSHIGHTELALHALSEGRYDWSPLKKTPLPCRPTAAQSLPPSFPSATWGRFGLRTSPEVAVRGSFAADERVLVVGVEEHQYRAFLLAEQLEQAGVHAEFVSTTRAPVQVGHAIDCVLSFPDCYGEGRTNYLYNVQRRRYDRVILAADAPSEYLSELKEALDAELW